MRPADFDSRAHGHTYHFAVTGADEHSVSYLVTDTCPDTDRRPHAEPKSVTITFTYREPR
jgi:hypothetical protein